MFNKQIHSLFQQSNSIVFGILSIITSFLILTNNGERYSFPLLLIFEYISISSLYSLFLSVDKLPYSLNKTYSIFLFFFFGLSPALQFKEEVIFFNSELLAVNDYLKTAIIIALGHTFYLIFYHFLIKRGILKISFKNKAIKNSNNLVFFYFLLSVIALVVFLVLVKFDYKVIFKRPPNHWQKVNTRFGLVGYTLLLVVRAIPVILLLIYELRCTNKNVVYRWVLILIVLLTAFPLSLGRGTLAFYYLPMLIVYVPFFKRKLTYSLFFISSILFVFPVLNYFRGKKRIDIGLKQFLTAHFDAYHNFSFLIREKIITNGEQLVGSIFFFMPQSKWENKPVGSGQMIAEKLNFSFTNISMPFLGEGYVNFGYLGMLIAVVFLIMVNSFFDINYKGSNGNVLFKIVFLFLLGFEFYLLRGDLYSSVKLSVSYFIALSFVLTALLFLNKWYNKKSV